MRAGTWMVVLCGLLALGCDVDTGERVARPQPSRRELPPGMQAHSLRSDALGGERRYLLQVPAAAAEGESLDLVLFLPGIGADPDRLIEVLPQLGELVESHRFALVLADTTGYIGSSRFVRENRLNELHAEYLFALVDHVTTSLLEERGLAVDRRFLVGGSAGGAGVWHLVGRRPGMWAGLGLVAAAGNTIPVEPEALGHLRVAFLQGDRDTAVDVGANRERAARLRDAGVVVQMHEIPGAGHDVARTRGLPELFEFLLARPGPE